MTLQYEIEKNLKIGKYDGLFDEFVYKLAYEHIKSKPGNMIPGADIEGETLDGISNEWIKQTILLLKSRSFQFRPSRRTYIPKANAKMRPLGIPSPRDKIVQYAIKLLIEPLFEPIFLDCSHGFRPGKSTETALKQIRTWTGITWMIEGDIKSYFDNINHHLLARALENKIKDQNLIDLYWKMVNAGYVHKGEYEPHGLTGVPQGGILSPLLSNIYLHSFDEYMMKLINQYTPNKGERIRGKQPKEYTANLKRAEKIRKVLDQTIKTKGKGSEEVKNLLNELRQVNKERLNIPSIYPTEETRRLYYVRYADDWIIGVRGPKNFAEEIKEKAAQFLSEKLLVPINDEKTRITHMTTDKAHFLGVDIFRRDKKYTKSLVTKTKSLLNRKVNNKIIMYVPIEKIVKKLINQNYLHADKRPKAVTKWVYLKPEEIIIRYNAVIRGINNYYYHVDNRNTLSYLNWIMLFSAAFTLARKLNRSPAKVFKRYGNRLTISYADGKRVQLDIPTTLARQKMRSVTPSSSQNKKMLDPFKIKYYAVRSHFVLDKPCKICGAIKGVEMHHVKHIRKGKIKGFTKIMSQLNRKQIPVCRECHMKIHKGTLTTINKL